MPETTITATDYGTTIAVKPRQTIIVRLDEVPTSGYRWEVCEMDNHVLSLENSNFTQSSNVGIGGGGTRTFTFEAKKPGTSALMVELRQEWDRSQPEDQFAVTIQVRE